MNWIKEFNKLEKKYTDEVLDILIDFEDIKERKFSEQYIEAYDLLYQINNTEIVDVKERIDRNEEKWKNIIKCLPNIGQELNCQFNKTDKILRELERQFIRDSGKYINRRDMNLYMKRCCILRNKIDAMTKSIQNNYSEELVDILIQILYESGKLLSEEEKEKYEEIKEVERMIDYKKIFNYKDMEELALKSGYKKVRQRGDHMIYKNISTNKIVPIVAHEFGIGLSRVVQKQLYKNSLAA